MSILTDDSPSLLESDFVIVSGLLPLVEIRKFKPRPIIFISILYHYFYHIVSHIELLLLPVLMHRLDGILIKLFRMILTEI